ncbi:hypothetical protein [Leifsonia shinshuensis]|uniref:hypothetical protein n=1 Tax=Leifsonia shinshuensis TaxID=150026 RepID=UPI0028607A74|nr:hypothetical protein [Leifsonia shinshuensis]MDR6973168.1 hypothetical protein [Leifsonia shinshuensis]
MKRSSNLWIPLALGVVVVVVDVVGIMFKGVAAGVDSGTLVVAIPSCLAIVVVICVAGLMATAHSRALRTTALATMFPDAVIENVNDQVGRQLYHFRSLIRDPVLVERRYLARSSLSIVVTADSIQGWVGSRHPRRAFLLPKSAIASVSLGESAATPIAVKPAMKVVLDFDGTVGDVFFMFGGGKSRNSWSLLSESQTQGVVRKVQQKLSLAQQRGASESS